MTIPQSALSMSTIMHPTTAMPTESNEAKQWERERNRIERLRFIRTAQRELYPRGQHIAFPFIIVNPIIDESFLGTPEGRIVRRAAEWLYSKQSVLNYNSPATMYQEITHRLSYGTCRGQSITFLLNRRPTVPFSSITTQSERIRSVFLQARFHLQYWIKLEIKSTFREINRNENLIWYKHCLIENNCNRIDQINTLYIPFVIEESV